MAGGSLSGPDVTIDGVSFDSRSIEPGQLFVPIVAGRDGHEFIADAMRRGAAAYLTSRPPEGGTAIEVVDTMAALARLAAAMRQRFHGSVVGITGSVGKTSTKDLTRAAVGAGRRTWASERSFNNEQGLPTTVLNTPTDAEVMVLEMGMRGHGEITALCDIAAPGVGVVTRVAEAHSDRVGGIEGVARAKSELVRALPATGTAVLNADDHRVAAMAGLTSAQVVTFGTQSSADVCVSGIVVDVEARPSFTVRTPWGTAEVRLALRGAHMALNAAAALAVAGVIGVDLVEAATALSDVAPGEMRMNVRRAGSGAVVLDDSYNANPTSMRAALDALVALPATRRIAVVGVMAEIADAEREHRQVAAYAAERGVVVMPVGTDLYGISPVVDADSVAEALAAAFGSLAAGDAVLVKGSRVAGLDRVAAVLCR
ncbi:MAG: UDP-N-acetylmuramoyl-tripeptide--D-alanyl-D-alanine ligase [Actinomycetota bacterium]|jgi:UDP-N-acetylmuramoyl-tripeptide--D-alanyl-D-alanine ligase